MHIIYVATLADFVDEVGKERPIRLTLTRQDEGNRPPRRCFTLTLGGINDYAELVILHDQRTIMLDPQAQTPWTPGGQSLAGQVELWYDLVRDFLAAHGYTVRAGMYAVPRDFTALTGSFDEAARWRCTAKSNGCCDAWVVEAPLAQPE